MSCHLSRLIEMKRKALGLEGDSEEEEDEEGEEEKEEEEEE